MLLSSLVTVLHSSSLQIDPTELQLYIKKMSRSFLSEIQRSPDELKLRKFLTVLKHVNTKVESSLELIVDLWKHFSSETAINSSCRLKSMTLDGQTSIPASSSAWLEMVENISELSQPSSFMMFVQICHQNLINWKNNPGISHCQPQFSSSHMDIDIFREGKQLEEDKSVHWPSEHQVQLEQDPGPAQRVRRVSSVQPPPLLCLPGLS